MILPDRDIYIMTVRNATGYPSTDLGTLCGGTPESAARINKWSRYKPVRYNVDCTDDIPDWWRGMDGKCGLNVISYSSVGSMSTPGTFLYQLSNNLDKWDYIPPTGGASSPFRLGDFRKYNTDAIPPVEAATQEDYFINSNSLQIDFDLAVPSGAEYNLSLSDFHIGGVSLEDFYMGAMIRRNETYLIGTSETTMGSMQCSLLVDGLTASHKGRWTVYPFFSDLSFPTTGEMRGDKLICAPIEPFKINIHAPGTLVVINCMAYFIEPWDGSSDRRKIECYLMIINNNSAPLEVSGMVINITYTDRVEQDGSSGLVAGTLALPDKVTVPPKNKDNPLMMGPYEMTARPYIDGKVYQIGVTMEYPTGQVPEYVQIEEAEQKPIRYKY